MLLFILKIKNNYRIEWYTVSYIYIFFITIIHNYMWYENIGEVGIWKWEWLKVTNLQKFRKYILWYVI